MGYGFGVNSGENMVLKSSIVRTNIILKIITFCRYLFFILTAVGMIVVDSHLPFAEYFYERRIEILLRGYFVFEAGYWALKYKKLAMETGRK